jgi:hypothetical protein
MFFLSFCYVSYCVPVDHSVFCFVFPFYFSHPSYNRKYSCAPLLSAPQKAKKNNLTAAAVSAAAQLFLEKKKAASASALLPRDTLFSFPAGFCFQNRPRYARVAMACFHSPPAHALGAPRDGAAAPNPRWPLRPVGGGQCVCFFSSTR